MWKFHFSYEAQNNFKRDQKRLASRIVLTYKLSKQRYLREGLPVRLLHHVDKVVPSSLLLFNDSG